jgi:hypothetical protein
MDLSRNLRASGLLAAEECAAAIDDGWTVSEFKEVALGDLRRIYALRLERLRSKGGAHAAQLARSTEELVGRLSEIERVEVAFVRGSAEHEFLVFNDPDAIAPVGVLRVVGKLTVASERWEQLWSGN